MHREEETKGSARGAADGCSDGNGGVAESGFGAQVSSVRLVPRAGTRGPKHFEQKTFSPEFILSERLYSAKSTLGNVGFFGL